MKRTITILLALLLFAAVACTAPETDPTPTQAAELPTEQPTEQPTATEQPTEEPTPEPTEEPTPEPTEEPTPEPTPVEIKTVFVSNVDEFLAAIAPNTEIILEAGTYDLTAASKIYVGDNPYCAFKESDFWPDSNRFLKITGADNLSIKAADGAECIFAAEHVEATIAAESCSSLTFSGITFVDGGGIKLLTCMHVSVDHCIFQSTGHAFAARSCEDVKLSDSECGSSIYIKESKRTTLSNLDIHDCGIALDMSGEDILVTGCRLHDCLPPIEPLPGEPEGDATIWINFDGIDTNVRLENCDIYGNKCGFLFDMYANVTSVFSDVRIYNNDTRTMFVLDEIDKGNGHTFTNCEIYNNKSASFISGCFPDTQVVLSGTSVHDNTIEGLFRSGDITVYDCAFRSNTVKRYFGYDEEWLDIQVSVHDPDGNELDEAALKAMKLKRQQPEAAQEPPDATKLPCSTPFWHDVFLDENGKYTLTDVVLFICDFDGDGKWETLSCHRGDQSFTFLLDGEAFLTLDWVSYVTVIDLDPSTPYLNLIFANRRTSEAFAESFEMHLVNGEFVKGATVAACLRWDGEALRGGSITTRFLGTKDGSRIYAGENLEPQSEWFDCEMWGVSIIPSEEELENNRDELIQRGILLLVKKDLKGTISGGQPTVIPKGTYVYMTRWHESNTIVKVVTEDGKAVYLSTAKFDIWANSNSWDDYMRDFLAKNPDYDPSEFYSNGGYLINGLPQEVYFESIYYTDG